MGVLPDTHGRILTNWAETTLLNNTAAERVLTVNPNARWRLYGGIILNADDVTRDVRILIRDPDNKTVRVPLAKAALGVGDTKDWPRAADTAVDSLEAGETGWPVVMAGGWDIIFAWDAGGASAGGTAESSAIAEEWIEP